MKTTANIASYPPRMDSLVKMLVSVYNQFDLIHIYLNEYDKELFDKFAEKVRKAIPDIEKRGDNQKIFSTLGTGADNLTDNGKFHRLETITEPEIFFALDDDIEYPADYRSKTEENIEKYGCIATYHGRTLQDTTRDYYNGHRVARCMATHWGNQRIDVAGTGVTAFRTDYFHPRGLAKHELQRMSDLIFSLEAAKQKKMIGVMEHKAGWLKHIENKETIYETEQKNGQANQNRIAREIYELNYSNK